MYLYQQSAANTKDGSLIRIQDMIIRDSENKIHLQKINSKLVQYQLLNNIIQFQESAYCCVVWKHFSC